MTIKLKGSTDGSVSLQAPADTSPTGTDKTFTLPTADGTAGQVLSTNGSGALSFASVPALAITEVDQWYLNTDLTTSTSEDVTSSKVTRNNFLGAAAQIGTGMSVSSTGDWTFPSTGKWLVIFNGMFSMAAGDATINALIYVSTDGGTNYTFVSYGQEGNSTGNTASGSASAMYFLDVTDTSTVKVQFKSGSVASGSVMKGDAGHMETSFLFIRLGDT